MDEVTWAALTIALTGLGALYTWWAFRRRGAAAGLRGAGYTLLPAAAYLTNALELLTTIVTSVGDWAFGLVFRPTVWAGVVLAGMAMVLFVVSGFLRNREVARGQNVKRSRKERRSAGQGPEATTAEQPEGELGEAQQQPGVVDDDLADIEAILRNRGIT